MEYSPLNVIIFCYRSSPSTAITWSALGCNVASSSKVSSHVSAVAAAAKAATSGGRRQHFQTYNQNQRPTQATNRSKTHIYAAYFEIKNQNILLAKAGVL